MDKKEAKQKRDKQIKWLDKIHEATGDNWAQMTEACNMIAGKTGGKAISHSAIRNFYSNAYGNADNRLLSDRIVIYLAKAYDIEPLFDGDLSYDMDNDNSGVSEYCKYCKEYITQVSRAKGIYRRDIAKLIDEDPNVFSKLFNNHLKNGLNMGVLEKIKERFKYNFSPRFRMFLENPGANQDQVDVIGYVSLSSSDQVLLYPEGGRKKANIYPGVDAKHGRVIELKGPTINLMAKNGMLYYFNDCADGVGAECLDQTCFVETEDGRAFIKMIEPSHSAGLYRLHPLVGNNIEEAKLKKACKILHITQQ